jgi:hypothetical protein
MAESQIHQYAKSKGFHPQILERWLGWDQPSREALLRLAEDLKLGGSHMRDLMDWLEEIALRDRSTIAAVLMSKPITEVASNPRLGRADKVKRVKDAIRRLRFPRLANTEDSIRARIQELKLDPRIRLMTPPGLEGGRLRVELSASTAEELKKLIDELVVATGTNTLKEIFALLAGETVEPRLKSDQFFSR